MMRLQLISVSVLVMVSGLVTQVSGQTLRTAGNFAVLGGSAVTNTGLSVFDASVGVWPGVSITGFPPGLLAAGAMHPGDMPAQQAQADLTACYNQLAAMTTTQVLSGVDLGGRTLSPGVYRFDSSAQLTGLLTLDAMGNADAVFVFQIGSTLTTASASSVMGINGANGCNVFWQVGSSATLGSGTSFEGNIVALASITLNAGAVITDGRALARNGAVTMDSNSITSVCIPAPAASVLWAGIGLCALRRRRRTT